MYEFLYSEQCEMHVGIENRDENQSVTVLKEASYTWIKVLIFLCIVGSTVSGKLILFLNMENGQETTANITGVIVRLDAELLQEA
jgi:hypothetical protein